MMVHVLMSKHFLKKNIVQYSLWLIVFFSDNGEEVWGRGEEEGHEDHHGAGPEGDGPAGDAGEGGGPGLLCHQQEHRRPPTDVPAGLYH